VLVSVKAVTTLNERLVLSFLSSMIGEKRDEGTGKKPKEMKEEKKPKEMKEEKEEEEKQKSPLLEVWGQTKKNESKEKRMALNNQIWSTIKETVALSPNRFILLLAGHSFLDIPWVGKFLLEPENFESQKIGVVLTEGRYCLHGLLDVGKCLQGSEKLESHWLEPPNDKESLKRKRSGERGEEQKRQG